jgi:hypothetical protein
VDELSAIDSTAREAREARRWKKELMLAEKRERDWTQEAEKIVKRYRGEEKKRNRFNILWSNTEILRPAIYNSKPNPDVRRRFRDADPLGKAVSEVLERSLQCFVDGDEFDDALKNDVLDSLLPGRGISRIRYVPKIAQVKSSPGDDDDEDEGIASTAKSDQPADEPDEELESEYVCVEHVDWKDFRHGYGRVWPEVPWEGFRHKLTRKEAEEKFDPKELEKIEFTVPIMDDEKKPNQEVGETEKVSEFWEIWDKNGGRVFFLHDSIEHLLFPKDNSDGTPPIEFDGFYPNPKPLSLVENTGSLLPTPIFRLYEDQATQLDLISGRIDKIVKSMRLRGIYDARLPEMADLLSSDDNEMVPTQNAKQWMDGGLDKAVSWVPVEKNAEILTSLYEARDRQKAIIDELLGISDIIRGATDPDETATAQNLKSNYGSVRLQRMQKEVQRYARDLLRLAAAAMGEKFAPDTFTSMTELKFPTAQQKAVMVQIFQQRAMAQQALPPGAPPGAQSPGPPPGPPQPQAPIPGIDPGMLNMPTWEDIIGVMRSEKKRQFKIDVETDSTVAGTLSSDMAGLSQVLTAISQAMQELAPMVQSQVLPVDAAKEIILTVIRRARMGMAVEDAFDKLKAPPPPPDPNAIEMAKVHAKVQGDIQIAQMSDESEARQFQVEEQAKRQTEAIKEQLEQQRIEHDAQVKLQMDERDKAHEAQLAQIKVQAEADKQQAELLNQRVIADADNQTKLMIAQLQAQHQAAMQSQQQEHDKKMAGAQQEHDQKMALATAQPASSDKEEAPPAADYKETESELSGMMKQLIVHLNTPKKVVRDENGRISGLA